MQNLYLTENSTIKTLFSENKFTYNAIFDPKTGLLIQL